MVFAGFHGGQGEAEHGEDCIAAGHGGDHQTAQAHQQRTAQVPASFLAGIAGAADHKNPESVSAEELEDWKADPGIEVVGAIRDVPAFWADVHVACLASRGGEGLPRSLLEAAACGRAIVTTNVPGCGDFVRDGVTGYVVPSDDVSAMASQLRALAEDRALRQRMGAAGREMIVASYTEQHAAACAARAWERLMQFRRA